MIGVLSILLAYLIGGIPFGVVVVRLMTGRDVRAEGSGNIGATNVHRTSGRVAGILTLALDIGKGWVAVWLADRFTGGSIFWMSAAAMTVMLGHAFSIWLKGRGGKAVATFLGAFAYLTPLPLIAVLLLFVAVLAWTRYLSLGSVVGAALFPIACWMILHPAWPVLGSSVGAAVLIVWRHAGNIERIRNESERVFRW